MIQKIQRSYFEIWANEEAQNSILKWLLLVLGILFLLQSVVLAVVCLRKPVLIAIGNDETRVFRVTPPSSELLTEELRRTVKAYVEAHYNWDSTSVEKAHEQAARYVSKNS